MSQTNSIYAGINDRRTQLLSQVTQGIQDLATQKANALEGIAQWFSSEQQSIQATRGQNIIALGQQALQTAMNAVANVQASATARQNSLLQWAENNATTINQLKSNLAQVASYNPTLPTMGTLPSIGGGTVGSNGQYYPGSSSNQQINPLTGLPY